jgi:prepilin peptidase CpaA
MANDLTAPPVGHTPAEPRPDDLGIDRAFLLSMARIPLIAVLWAAAAWVASAAVVQFGWFLTITPAEGEAIQFNLGPLAVISFGMLLAAFIDGYYFKVPNWCTLSLVVSGWYIGLAHDLGWAGIAGHPQGAGGIGAALAGTLMGFLLLFPALFIRGMGQGDVKMTMGFGSWLFAYAGIGLGAAWLFWSFAIGVIIGGVFGLVIMALRRQFYKNASNFRAIVTDLQVLVTAGPAKAAERAEARKKDWWRLPYGVPLCAGFLGYLWYVFFVAN